LGSLLVARDINHLPYIYISEKTPQKETDLKKYMGVLEK
jgi:hypothetical protein